MYHRNSVEGILLMPHLLIGSRPINQSFISNYFFPLRYNLKGRTRFFAKTFKKKIRQSVIIVMHQESFTFFLEKFLFIFRPSLQSFPVAYVWSYMGIFIFLIFTTFAKEVQKQMIPHLKALKYSVQNQERFWVWHHSEGSHALLTEKAPLPVKLVWSV